MEVGETLEAALAREVREETCARRRRRPGRRGARQHPPRRRRPRRVSLRHRRLRVPRARRHADRRGVRHRRRRRPLGARSRELERYRVTADRDRGHPRRRCAHDARGCWRACRRRGSLAVGRVRSAPQRAAAGRAAISSSSTSSSLDRDDQPVTDLRQDEFQVKEDGQRGRASRRSPHVTALGSLQPDDGRVVVLLMDDIGVPITRHVGDAADRAGAALAARQTATRSSVVRLSSRSDEAFGDFSTARDRIDGYRGGAVPFSMPRHAGDGAEGGREDLAAARGDRAPPEGDHLPRPAVGLRRRASRRSAAHSVLWPALGRGDRRRGARQRQRLLRRSDRRQRRLRRDAAAAWCRLTGGGDLRQLRTTSRARPTAIWREAGHYYLLGYWPAASKRELHVDRRQGRAQGRPRPRAPAR